eukprot:TRINITY_DN19301_c0_g1_i4.p1 TRINITY_DN19301_c0_g1~~TRINITY_DN19301_c0_g1_i4.p1  ORF type:complete len:461 (-),score=65.66 TRINITY_DN19301_c0_g1_i4:187-1569(-)
MGKRDADTADLDASPELHTEVQLKLKQLYETTPVQDGDLEERTLAMLSEFDVDSQLRILDEFGNSNFQKIRSKDAYLRGTISKKRRMSLSGLPPRVQSQLDKLYDRSLLKYGDLDDRCLDALRSLDEHCGLRAIEKLTTRNLKEIRNMSAFFMSQIKQVEKEARDVPVFDNMASGQFGMEGGIYPNFGGGMPLLNVPNVSQVGQVGMMNSMGSGERHNYGVEQAQMGIRINEYHNLSQYDPYVHTAPSLKLQQLWDNGVKLVALLDAQSWEALANMDGPEALVVIDETAQMLESGSIRNVNAYFTSKAKRQLNEGMLRSRMSRNGRPPVGRYGGGTPRDRRRNDGGYYSRSNSYSYQSPSMDGWSSRSRGRGNDGSDQTIRSLPTMIRQKVEEILDNHRDHISESNFDAGVVQALKSLPEESSLVVLSQLDDRDLSSVRNVSGYIIGICRTVQREIRGQR